MKRARILQVTTMASASLMIAGWGLGTIAFYYRLRTGTASMGGAAIWGLSTFMMEVGSVFARDSLAMLRALRHRPAIKTKVIERTIEMAKPADVQVPGQNYEATLNQRIIWDITGLLINDLLREHCTGQELYGAMLSRVSRELRREFGVEGARAVFQGFADTQDEAVRFDK